MIIGSHVQMKAPDYLLGAVREALSYGANALMLYTGAPQNTKRVDTSVMKIEEAHRLMRENGLDASRLIVHAPYIINPANSVKPEVGELAVSFLSMDAQRTAQIGAKYLVLHPGSYTTTDITTGIQTAIAHLNEACIPDGVTVCLETMAGKGSEIGYRFEQLKQIRDGVQHPERIGICLDTCHVFAAGYDIVHDLDGVLDEFDRILGLELLRTIHLNDSLMPFGSRKDRHAVIGEGEIGLEALLNVLRHPKLKDLPFYLETPLDDAGHKEEIARLKEYLGEE